MAKRFTDTGKYKKAFIRSLPGPYKLLWDYLYHDCDHAGIWQKDFQIAQIYLGPDMPIDEKKALELFNKDEQRIVSLNGGSKWFIRPFIEFQYGPLNPENKVHFSILTILEKEGIKGLASPLQGAKEKDKEKDKERDRDILSLSSIPDKEVGATILPIEAIPKKSPQTEFVERFKTSYEKMTGQPFKLKKEYFVIAAKLLKDYGQEAVFSKVKILGLMCRDRSAWFTKGGWADFSIDKLSSKWNEIIPDGIQENAEDKENRQRAEIQKKVREQSERTNSIMGRK